jgi:hypothetical protein
MRGMSYELAQERQPTDRVRPGPVYCSPCASRFRQDSGSRCRCITPMTRMTSPRIW